MLSTPKYFQSLNSVLCFRIVLRNQQVMAMTDAIVSVEFEVFGKVQGVSFTKYCKDMCEQLNVRGWVKNTKKGTIQGKIQGSRAAIEHMVVWLSNTGSPGSKVDHCDLANWQTLARPDFNNFSMRF